MSIYLLHLISLAAGAALLGGLVGAWLLWTLRRRSVRVQVMAVALTAVVATAAGAVVASAVMFISAKDLRALLVVLAAAGSVGVACAVVLGNRVADATRSLSAMALRMAEPSLIVAAGEMPPPAVPGDAPEDLERLKQALAEASLNLEEIRGREQALESSRRELVAWVSHDLRTPLAGIRAMVEALEDGVVVAPATVAQYHAAIRGETERLGGLVDDLFELSRIHAGALMLRAEAVQLGDLVSDAVAAAKPVAAERGIRIEGSVHGLDPVVVLSPPELLRVLRNLLDNAIRHSPVDAAVVVAAGVAGEAAFVEVRDSCGGIPADDLDRVFDLAFRGDSARTPDDKGGGLGLAIARGIIEAHHGDIAVRNDGEGCRFTIRLPLPGASVATA